MHADEDMDGTAIALALAPGPGPDWLKDVVKKVGLRLKVHNALRTLCNECEVRTATCKVIMHTACIVLAFQ